MAKTQRSASSQTYTSLLDKEPLRQLLEAIEGEEIPERLLELARELQEKLRAAQQEES